ncbi:MAG: hypothetical protein Salg2KO_22220 [Salibacteraceae bacterium]
MIPKHNTDKKIKMRIILAKVEDPESFDTQMSWTGLFSDE